MEPEQTPLKMEPNIIPIDDNDTIECQVDKLYKENEHFINSMMCINNLDEMPNNEYVEVNEQVDCYVLKEKVDAILHPNRQEDDDKSVFNTEATDIVSLKEYLGPKVNKRHYYLLIQKNNTLLNDAQQFRAKLLEKLATVENQLRNFQTQCNEKVTTGLRRFFSYRQHYFTDDNLFPCPNNSDKMKIDIMNVGPIYIPQARKWNFLQMEKLKKIVSRQILEKKVEVLSQAKSQGNAPKVLHLQKELDVLSKLPAEEIPRYAKDMNLDWDQIATKLGRERDEMSDKTGEDCRHMWNLCLAPSINQKSWSQDEDKRLVQLALKNHNKDWDTIAQQLGTGRSGFQCFTHYQLRFNPTPSTWTHKEDAILLDYISKHKHTMFKNFSLMPLAFRLRTRSMDQIRQRLKSLKNTMTQDTRVIKKGPFTPWEVNVIETCVKQRLTFQTIANLLGNRTAVQIRDKMARKYVQVEKKRKGVFTLEEDRKLMNLCLKYGIKSWSFIAKKMKTRDRTQCRHRYNNMRANVDKGIHILGVLKKEEVTSSADPVADSKPYGAEGREQLDTMLDLLTQGKSRKPAKRRILKYQRKPKRSYSVFHSNSPADQLIQDYFDYARLVPQCTSRAIKEDALERNFKGDALLAMTNYLQVKPDPELLRQRPLVTRSDVSPYWNLAEYPHVIEWYRAKMLDLERTRSLSLRSEDEGVDTNRAEDLDLNLPSWSLSNRYSIHSMLDSDFNFYKSNVVYEPIRSKQTQARIVLNNNGATTRNDIVQGESTPGSTAKYFFPVSTTTLKAFEKYKTFQANIVNTEDVFMDYSETDVGPITPAGEAAMDRFQTRLQNLFTASHLLVKPIKQKQEPPCENYPSCIGWLIQQLD
ncbi:uncharacterized protein LOC103511207 [Diaphorina citri]|uniref:Uncharacterized protein LOC103511207 n=1 Tax=Diaphorina citri TaxID=121845 RepID=A0A1S4EE57_DIACI|nr:uncharacterized protein LOC103511207 [Diaphorina citri]